MGCFKDHFSEHAACYASARPDYPAKLFAWLAQQAPSRESAWDCATGNGQAALGLAKHFKRVHATDASSQQIANARAHERVHYTVASAEHSNLPDARFDLITVAQAAHWFDLSAYYADVRRALKPRGMLAMWGYGLTRINPEVDQIIDRFDEVMVGSYWPPERRHIDNAYEDLEFPFPRIDAPAFAMRKHWALIEFLTYIRSWSAVQRYQRERRSDPMDWLQRELEQVWGIHERRDVCWPLFILAGINDDV